MLAPEFKRPKHHSVERDLLVKYLRGALKNDEQLVKLKGIRIPLLGGDSPINQSGAMVMGEGSTT